ncbi:MAG: homocysteine S-methyltransferase family protein [Syntrophomonadaceae bacterium]|nr:homocysteine S-methyltransferase family protein [Syntrophomonadaceae bacterium]
MDLSTRLKEKILILDGAMGTMLQANGMKAGECPELFGANNPAVLKDIHYQYAEAGSDIIQTNTFGANRFKLDEYGLGERTVEINTLAVQAAREGARGHALVAASIGPTGKLLRPMGDVDFDDLYEVFREQVLACEKAGADLLSIETMGDIGEMRAALIAARHNTRLPVLAHMTFENGGRTMMGTDPLTALIIIEGLQPLAIGANCSGGARELLPVIEKMARFTSLYLSVEPNAGMPALINGNTVFPDSPEDMAEYALRLRDAGANIIGGCCGTTPAHIRAIASVIKGLAPIKREGRRLRALASRGQHILLGNEHPMAFIGERINPTARKKLAQDIREGKMQVVVEEARQQVAGGAPMLDVNMGVPGIDEANAMREAVLNIQAAVDVPLSLDSTNAAAIEEGLKSFVGRPLINSTTGEDKQLDIVLPLAKKYGAAILGLCLDDSGIPYQAEARVQIARKIRKKALEYGLRDEDIFIDCLVKTASAEQSQVMETLKALRIVKEEMNLGTVLGVSNVSHGLPAREILNSSYLSMAWAAGLDLPIMNPFEERMMDANRAAAVLLNRDLNSAGFIEKYRDYKPGGANATIKNRHEICLQCNIPELIISQKTPLEANKQQSKVTSLADVPLSIYAQLSKAVLEGNTGTIETLILKVLDEDHIAPLEVINQGLIPGIESAGQLYEQKKYFLPQLMMAAETMKRAFAIVKPRLGEEASQSKGVIIMATVEGDIHDIGKNIVTVMLENYGYRVIDLGKDVEAEKILDVAQQEKADIIGLSALMTTTMPHMSEVIEGVKARGLPCLVMVGGAVLNQEYADSIGADAYSEDARQAVLVTQMLLGKSKE